MGKLKPPARPAQGNKAKPLAGRKKIKGTPKKTPKSPGIVSLIVAAASFVGLLGCIVWTGRQKRKKDVKFLEAMGSRPLQITEHASCRMDCRHINRGEITKMLGKDGILNHRKSDMKQMPCPKVVVDARFFGKSVQGVFAACPTETRVVTVIDKSTNWACGPC